MMHQKIRPQTMMPTANAAIVEPTHRPCIRRACTVMPCGQPKENAWLIEQPDRAKPVVTASAIRAVSRPRRSVRVDRRTPEFVADFGAESLATTWWCLLRSAAADAVRGRASSTLAMYSTKVDRPGVGWPESPAG